MRDLVALSLLPWSWRGRIAERLRAGEAAGDLLVELLAERPRPPSCRAAPLAERAASALETAARRGIEPIGWTDEAYPPLLRAIFDPPPVLWLRGARPALDPPAVAVVGSRAGSPYAVAVAEQLATDLAARGIAVVSGLARGVDSAAHRGALAAGGVTIAVLGSGADVVYPREHAPLARDIARGGAVVSELVPGTPPQPHFFPMRNRIISGLSRAVVVIEAGERSGSLITARCALDQGRDVLAVPGNVLTGRNRGGHGLLRDGARIVETADDIVEELQLGLAGASPRARGARARADGPPEADAVLASLAPGEACDVDTVAERSGIDVARLLPRLLDLELQGRVRRTGGGRFVRVDRSC
jgi:DNA processing protein